MLDYKTVKKYYESGNNQTKYELVHAIDGYKNFDIYKDRTRRELCYRGGDNAFTYTFQVDDDGLVFAAFVQGPNFSKIRLKNHSPEEFSDKALVLDGAEHTSWSLRITDEIHAKAQWAKKQLIWEKDGTNMKMTVGPATEKVLQYIAITSDIGGDAHGG